MEEYTQSSYYFSQQNLHLAQKKILSIGPIDVHPTEFIIILNYSLQLIILSHNCDETFEKVVTCRKFIRLYHLFFESDIYYLVHWIISKCNKILNSTFFGELNQLVVFLRDRQSNTYKRSDAPDSFHRHSPSPTLIDNFEISDISKIQNYFYQLYEGVHEKIKATSFILILARQPENLSVLIRNEVLIGALVRVLRDDWKKCMEITRNIIYIFYCLSSFSSFHVIVSKYKIGSLCMQIIQNEIFRNKLEINEFDHDELSTEAFKSLAQKNDFLDESNFRRQEEILLIAVYLLLHISENKIIEMKMLKKGLIYSLITLLDRSNLELLILSVCFLKKLSIFKENKDLMLKSSIITRLQRVISIHYLPLKQITWRLIFNLSFDNDFQKGFFPKFFPDFRISDFVHSNEVSTLFDILYHISFYPNSYTYFQDSETILCFRQLIHRFEDDIIDRNFVALLVNLHQSFHFAKLILDVSILNFIVNRSFDVNDPTLLKIVNTGVNHIEFDETLLLNCVYILLNQLHICTIEVMLLEVYKILNCISLLDSKLILPSIDFNLINSLVRKIKNMKYLEDDLLLEIIIFISRLANDQFIACMFIHNGLIYILTLIFSEKQEDDEIVIHIIYLIYTLLFHPMTRKTIISESRLLAYLSELLNDKNLLVASYSDDALNLVNEQDPPCANSILLERFNWHNLQWLKLVNDDSFEEMIVQNTDIDNILLQFVYSKSEVEFI